MAYITTITITSRAMDPQTQPRPKWLPAIPAQMPPTSRSRRPRYVPPKLALERSRRAEILARSRSREIWMAIHAETPWEMTNTNAPTTWSSTIQGYMGTLHSGPRGTAAGSPV
jgi:hypothetical protein